MNLKIEYIDINKIRPYERNARKHTDTDLSTIVASIKEFGFSDPIGIWKDTIVEGHGRLEAAKKLGMKEVPCIRLDHLSDEQRRAYALAHNKTAEMSEWDFGLLDSELDEIIDIDMSEFGFDTLDDVDDFVGDIDDRRSSLQHNVFENQERMQFDSDNWYGIPTMNPTQTIGDKLLRFCDFNDVDNPSEYIAHFYYDDYKFIQAWKDPDKYLDKLKQFKAIISPDFSLYTDFPRALQILSCYRRQWCGAYWQKLGLDVIPDVVWGDEESFKFCFEGIPEGGTVAVSSVGVKNDKEWNNEEGEMFKRGYDEMMKRLNPSTIIFYGSMIYGLEGNIIRVPSYYEQKFSRKE